MAAKVTAPVQAGDPVSSSTNAALATIKAQDDDWDIIVVTQSLRNSGYWRETKKRFLMP
jgi:hypothetical protein